MKTSAKKSAIVQRKRQPKAIVRRPPLTLAESIEKVLIGGDLAPLTVEQRLDYYKKVCVSLGLNPLTRPFDYIVFDGRMALYARRDCTDQLRKLHGISVVKITRTTEDGMLMAEATVRDRKGNEDSAIGAISLSVWDKWAKPPAYKTLSGLELANARMKVETKAKRRATLSICGLGFLDMSELDTLDNYSEVTPGGRIVIDESKQLPPAEITEKQLEQHDSITVTPWKDDRLALTGNGLAIVKSEIEPEALAELGIVRSKDKVVHMPAAKVFLLEDRAKKCGVEVHFAETVSQTQPPANSSAPAQGSLL